MLQSSIYRMKLGDLLTICVLALLCLGMIMVQSAAMSIPKNFTEPSFHLNELGVRHAVFVAIALVTFFVVGHIDYALLARGRGLRSPIFWMLAIAVVACVLVLVPQIGRDVNGARRWLPLGFTQVQPSELGKWAIVLFLAWWFAHRPVDLDRFSGFVTTLIPVGLVCLLIVIEDFGTAALIGIFTLVMCLAGRVRLWHLAVVIPPALGAACVFVMHKEYRMKRMLAFLDPFAAPEREGYHMIQSLLSFSTGGLWGRGIGRGIQKLGYLPEDTTDFIFAVICEEMGLFGALLTIALYAGILYIAWQCIKQKKDPFGQLLAFGIAAMIGLQALINIAVATVSMPTKGLSLPLISAGGSGLVITSAALGLLYSACRYDHGECVEEPAHAAPEPASLPEPG